MSKYNNYKEYLSGYLKSNHDCPRSIFMEITPLCNLRCVFCPCYIEGEEVTRDRLTDYMSLENFKRIVDRIVGRFNFQICFTYSGEPLINKELYQMLSYLGDRSIPSVVHSNAMILTRDNASKLLESRLDRFIVSFDGATKETYEDVRRGSNFDRVIDNIRGLLRERDSRGLVRPFVEMQFVVTSKNRHEIPLFKGLCNDLGVDNAYIKSLLVFQDTKNKNYVEKVKGYFIEDDVARYEATDSNELVLKNMGPCPEIHNCVVTVDGDVVICCFDVHGRYPFGNCLEHGLDEIWKSREYVEFREEVMGRRGLPICTFCNSSTHITRRVVNQ